MAQTTNIIQQNQRDHFMHCDLGRVTFVSPEDFFQIPCHHTTSDRVHLYESPKLIFGELMQQFAEQN